MLEGPTNKIESFDSFLDEIKRQYEAEGLSVSVAEKIENWHQENRSIDIPGVTLRDKIELQIKRGKLYIATGQTGADFAISTLEDAHWMTKHSGDTDLAAEIEGLLRSIE